MSIDYKTVKKHYGMTLAHHSILFRELAFTIDKDPDAIFNYIHEPAVEKLYTLRTLDTEYFFRLYEALSYGDIGTLFACPRTCLSGVLLQLIGSQQQQDYYFDYLANKKVRSFFATTEPSFGSDANKLETHLHIKEDGIHAEITGDKILVGNLGIANIGVVIGRKAEGPLGMIAALIKPEDFINNKDHIQRETLPMFGVRAATLGRASFQDFRISTEQLIGQHLKVTERGLYAVIKTFNVMRTAIAGLALGHAQAIIDYIKMYRKNLSSAEQTLLTIWQTELDGIRLIALEAAKHNQIDRVDTTKISLAKVRASNLVETIATNSEKFFGIEFLTDHPYLIKSLRDCFGYEYMDGTTNIQRKNVYQGFINAKL